jgi:hypothetical protein
MLYNKNLPITRNYVTRNYGPLRRIKQLVGVITRLLIEKFRAETLSACNNECMWYNIPFDQRCDYGHCQPMIRENILCTRLI